MTGRSFVMCTFRHALFGAILLLQLVAAQPCRTRSGVSLFTTPTYYKVAKREEENIYAMMR